MLAVTFDIGNIDIGLVVALRSNDSFSIGGYADKTRSIADPTRKPPRFAGALSSLSIDSYFPQIVCVFGCARLRVNQLPIRRPPKILQTQSGVEHCRCAIGECPCFNRTFTAAKLVL